MVHDAQPMFPVAVDGRKGLYLVLCLLHRFNMPVFFMLAPAVAIYIAVSVPCVHTTHQTSYISVNTAICIYRSIRVHRVYVPFLLITNNILITNIAGWIRVPHTYCSLAMNPIRKLDGHCYAQRKTTQ